MPEPRAELIDDIGERLGLAGGGFVQAPLLVVETLGRNGCEPQHVEAIARIEPLFGEPVEPLAQQAEEAGGIAQRPARSHGEALDRAVDAIEGRLQPPRAEPAFFEQGAEVRAKEAKRRLYVGEPRQSLGKAPLGDMRGGREARDDRLAPAAEQRVEPRHRRGAEAGCERRARTRQKIADSRKPGAGEARCGRRLELERRDGQRRGERFDLPWRQVRRDEAQLGESRQRMRQRRPSRQRCAGVKTLGVEALLDLVQQFRLAAEEAGRAGHVEHDAVRRIERGERREAGAPIGDRFERRRVGLRGHAPRAAGPDRARARRRRPCRA